MTAAKFKIISEKKNAKEKAHFITFTLLNQ